MDRRSFTRSALMTLAVAPTTARQSAAQGIQTLPFDYLALANAYAQSFLGVTRGTDEAKTGEQVATALLRSALSAFKRQFDVANKSATEVSSLAEQRRTQLIGIAKQKGLPEFDIVVTAIKDVVPDVSRFSKEPSQMTMFLPRRQVQCVTACVAEMALCAAPELLSSIISCGYTAAPTLLRGRGVFIGAFGGCLMNDVGNLLGDSIVGCFNTLRMCVGKCSGPQ